VILGVTGGIAAYKSVQVARDLTRLGARVDVIMSSGAQRFLQPLSFQGVTGREVYTDMFSGSGPAAHIRLGMEAEALVVAPATANFLARASQGSAEDLLSTTLLVTRAPVILCPAMNERMFSHPQTKENIRHLQATTGYRIAGPAQGPLAVGEGTGHGRMLEPEEIVQHVGRALGSDPAWEGRRVLVTAGPTREPLDPVRFIGNRSSGRMGFALAGAAWRRGADVTLVTGPTCLQDPVGIDVVRVETGNEMKDQVLSMSSDSDVLIFAAAVSDFKPVDANDQKLKRSRDGEGMDLRLAPTSDIAMSTLEGRKPGAVALGFALETEDLLPNARKKLKEKGFDVVAANDASEEGAGFDVDTNRVTILDTSGGVEELPVLPKEEVAEKLMDRLTRSLQGGV
jgi:phosphopantothenoylcysteine decarboxylase/phosphopantothenate--cysteine ligase